MNTEDIMFERARIGGGMDEKIVDPDVLGPEEETPEGIETANGQQLESAIITFTQAGTLPARYTQLRDNNRSFTGRISEAFDEIEENNKAIAEMAELMARETKKRREEMERLLTKTGA
jgi:hypothetical protein